MRLLLLLLPIFVFASSDVYLDWLKDKPKSIAKDFYIWRYLDKDITPGQANEAFYQSNRVNNKILFRWAKKSNDKYLKEDVRCMKLKAKQLTKERNADCIVNGLSTYKAVQLHTYELNKLANKLAKDYESESKMLKIIASKDPFSKMVIDEDRNQFFKIFNNCGSTYRQSKLNRKFSKKFIDRIKSSYAFYQTVKLIVTNPKMRTAQKSLLTINTNGIYSNHKHKIVFFLAMNAIKHKDNKNAIRFLEDAYKTAYFKMDKDKVSFWQYLITTDSKYLNMTAESWDNNIYSIYAKELLGQKIDNVISDIGYDKLKDAPIDITNQFEWIAFEKDLKKVSDKEIEEFIEKFYTKDTIGHLTYILERYTGYRYSFFPMPYDEYLKGTNIDRKALVFALGRQESRFIPSSISHSYAMGVMQFMPFVSKSIAKEKKEKYLIDKMLTPKKSYEYANHHLNFLEYRLKHPLLIAYAYNGGIGFTRGLLKKDFFKSKNSIFEPFLSMELVHYDESKRYGKKVLANYYIYKKLLGKPVKMADLIKDVLK
jgi:soluble lytic murein transglycosylase